MLGQPLLGALKEFTVAQGSLGVNWTDALREALMSKLGIGSQGRVSFLNGKN